MASPGRNIALETAGQVFPPAVFIKFWPSFDKKPTLGSSRGSNKQGAEVGASIKTGSRECGAGWFWETARGASPPSAGNNDQRLAPRSKATAVSAARVGWGNRKGSRCKAFRYVPPEHTPMDIWRLLQRKGPRLNRGSFLVRHGFI